MKLKPLIFIILIFLIIFIIINSSQKQENKEKYEGVFCTMDAKECPDGSFVGRVAPDCEFAPCE